LIIVGVVQGISLIGARYVPHFWVQLVSVVLFVIVGVLFLRHPGESLLTLTLLLIVLFMVEGIAKVIFALTIRPLANWGWVLVSGIIGLPLALFLWASIPVTMVSLLGLLLGIELICGGPLSACWLGKCARADPTGASTSVLPSDRPGAAWR
jgi:uncharacterized membrane protein HdeD (DUF308 family)